MSNDPTTREIWLLKATPTDPAQRPYFLGEGSLVFHSPQDAQRHCAEQALSRNPVGIATIEPVCVKL